jgi:hypothetical protein
MVPGQTTHATDCQHNLLDQVLSNGGHNLLVGNGINRHVSHGAQSWDSMLNDLAKVAGLSLDGSLIKTGLFPEVFDLLDMQSESQSITRLLQASHALVEFAELTTHSKVCNFVLEKGLELLTTNFDSNFEKSLPTKPKRIKIEGFKSNKRIWGWNMKYVFREPRSTKAELSIHHIHGDINFVSTILTSANHYASAISWVKANVINGRKNVFKALSSRCGYCQNCVSCYWPGRGTWLEIVLLGNLLTLGLALGRQEHFLRYLLMQRSKIKTKFPTKVGDYFITSVSKDVRDDRDRADLELFKALGSQVIILCNYDCIWESEVFQSLPMHPKSATGQN